MNPRIPVIMLVLALVLPALAQAEAAQEATEEAYIEVERTIELGKATQVGVSIEMQVGDLEVAGGAAELLKAGFETTSEALLPEIDYDEDEGDGELEIAQPADAGDSGEDDSEWHVRLNSGVTRSLDIEVGVGEVELDLGGFSLEETSVEVGVGEIEVYFSDREPRVTNVRFEVGVGEAHVRIPPGVGARVKVEVGMGDVSAEGFTETEDGWVTGTWKLSEAWQNVDMTVEVGVGDVSLELESEERGPGDDDAEADDDDDEEEEGEDD